MENQNTTGKESKRQTGVDIMDKNLVHLGETWQKKTKNIERYAKETLHLRSEVWKKIQDIGELMQYRLNNIYLAFWLQSDMIMIKNEESSFQGPSKQQALRRKHILQA